MVWQGSATYLTCLQIHVMSPAPVATRTEALVCETPLEQTPLHYSLVICAVVGEGSGDGHQRGLSQARKRHININFLVRLLLGHPGNVPGTNRVCPRDKVGLSQGQTQVVSLFYTAEAQFVPGTNPVCPWDIPGTKGGRKSLCVKSLCASFVPYQRGLRGRGGFQSGVLEGGGGASHCRGVCSTEVSHTPGKALPTPGGHQFFDIRSTKNGNRISRVQEPRNKP